MEYDILVTKQPTNGYLARPVLMPELVVSGADEAEVLALVQEAIARAAIDSRIVRIDVPIAHGQDNAVENLRLMEQAATDPQFLADLQETMMTFTPVDAEWWEPMFPNSHLGQKPVATQAG